MRVETIGNATLYLGDFSRVADSFAARLERQPGRNARGRYCKR